jgi:D-cysteine desulfhydrase
MSNPSVEFPNRLRLCHSPTPLLRIPRLSDRLGVDLWIKRDDANAGVEAGNKIRKLEFLLADALHNKCDTLVTCGGEQSNHCRATVILGARLGLKSIVYLRTEGVTHRPMSRGNAFLMGMAGAEIRWISPEQYQERTAIMEECAKVLKDAHALPYVIPEGGSNGLGSLGYVDAMREIRRQLDLGLAGGTPFDYLVHACGSGGTAAGCIVGAGHYNVAKLVRSYAVCNDQAYFETVIQRLTNEIKSLVPDLKEAAAYEIDDTSKGPRYGESSAEQQMFLVDLARNYGLFLDPVYTGKAMFGLTKSIANHSEMLGKRVLFIHTGGLPGLLAQGELLSHVV